MRIIDTPDTADVPPDEPDATASSQTPEARRRRRDLIGDALDGPIRRLRPAARTMVVVKRVLFGVYSDGFIHAGNLAYLALFTLFPFFIVTAALAAFFGQTPDTLRAVDNFLRTLPPAVGTLLRPAILDVLAARTGTLLWLGALVGLWTVGSFIETIRDILRRAYGTVGSRSFWHYRLGSVMIIISSVFLVLAAFAAQVMLTAAEQFVERLLPFAGEIAGLIGLSRLAPFAVMTGALYLLFFTLTPSRYRYSNCPKWPGAVFTATWWLLMTLGLPLMLSRLGSYDLTYGSMAGVIITLFFFWLVGFGLVIGAHLNAALAETPPPGLKDDPEADR